MSHFKNKAMKIAIIVVLVASLLYVFEYFMRVLPGALSRQLMGELNIQAGALSLISAGFFFTYVPMQIPAGLLCDRFGPKRCLVVAMGICVLATAMFAWAHSATWAFTSRILLGLGASFAFVGPVVLAGRWFASRYFAMVTGLIQVMGCVGAIMGGAPMVWLAKQYGWRPTVHGLTILGIGLVVLFVLSIRDWPASEAQAHEHEAHLSTRACLQRVLVCKQSWWVALASFACWSPIAIFAELWGIPFLMSAYHIPELQAATGVAYMWIGVAIGSPLVGYLSNRIERRNLPMLVCFLVGLLASLWVIYFKPSQWWMEEVALFVFGLTAAVQPITFALMQDIHCDEVAGTAAGFNNMAVIISGFIMQPIVGYLLQYGWVHRMVHGAPVYSLQNYQHALMLVPVSIFLGLLAAGWGIRETHCRRLIKSK